MPPDSPPTTGAVRRIHSERVRSSLSVEELEVDIARWNRIVADQTLEVVGLKEMWRRDE